MPLGDANVLFGLLWLVAAIAMLIYSFKCAGSHLEIYLFIGLLGASAAAFVGFPFLVQTVLGVHVFLIAITLGEIGPGDLFWLYFIITSVIFLAWYYWR